MKSTKTKKEYLYIYLKQREIQGQDYVEGDGGPYTGFHHIERITEKMGPAQIATESPDWDYEMVEEVDPRVFEQKPDYITVVYTEYYSGGTFGGTDGIITFEYASVDKEGAKKWLAKNKKRIEKQHSGWGCSLTSIDVEPIHLWK